MVIEWREREHEDDDNLAQTNLKTITVLWNYRLLKFLWIANMRAQKDLLQILVGY